MQNTTRKECLLLHPLNLRITILQIRSLEWIGHAKIDRKKSISWAISQNAITKCPINGIKRDDLLHQNLVCLVITKQRKHNLVSKVQLNRKQRLNARAIILISVFYYFERHVIFHFSWINHFIALDYIKHFNYLYITFLRAHWIVRMWSNVNSNAIWGTVR